jgi:hypothetical protein
MSDYAAATGAGSSRWRGHHLGPTTPSVLVPGQSTGTEPYSRYSGRKDEGPDPVYRPGPIRGDYENSPEELSALDQQEPYRNAGFRGPVYSSGDYGKWPISTGAPRPGSLSPKGPISHSSGDSVIGSPNSRPGHGIMVHSDDPEAMSMSNPDFDDDSEAHLSSDERRAEKRKMKRFR